MLLVCCCAHVLVQFVLQGRQDRAGDDCVTRPHWCPITATQNNRLPKLKFCSLSNGWAESEGIDCFGCVALPSFYLLMWERMTLITDSLLYSGKGAETQPAGNSLLSPSEEWASHRSVCAFHTEQARNSLQLVVLLLFLPATWTYLAGGASAKTKLIK